MEGSLYRQCIADEALNWLGTPYRHQSSLCQVGTDCLGLVRGVYRKLVGPEPVNVPAYLPYADHNEGELLWRASLSALAPAGAKLEVGNVLLFRMRSGQPARHLAIAVRDTEMVHAVSGRMVARIHIHPWWQRHCVARFDFPGVENE